MTGVSSLGDRVANRARGVVRLVRAHRVLNPVARRELRAEAAGHPVDDAHRPHLEAAIAWLERAQDATPDDGFARGYSLAWNPYFGSRGWQPSYPETTGYIIPTLYAAAAVLRRPDLADRATRAAEWEVAIQLESGAVRGGVIGQPVSPSVFNTGQVIFGWLAAHRHTGDDRFGAAAARAAGWLRDVLEADGHWRSGNSQFARSDATMYNARVAWAVAEAGAQLGDRTLLAAAARNLRAVAARQHANGWLPDCCLTDPVHPLLHTTAYAIRGLLEGGRVIGDEAVAEAGARAAAALLEQVRDDGWMAGRHNSDWSAAERWSCLTGQAQMANNWMRLHVITGETRWLEPVPRVLRFLKSTQNRTAADDGLRGGIKGSYPVSGGYGRYELLNWAAKYFADALMRHSALADAALRLPEYHDLA